MFEVTMLIPVRDNDGEAFSPEHHRVFEDRAVAIFGGLTRLPGEAAGVWTDGSRRYEDRTLVYLLAVAGLEAAGRVVDLARWACAHYRQEAIFIRYLGQAEIVGAAGAK